MPAALTLLPLTCVVVASQTTSGEFTGKLKSELVFEIQIGIEGAMSPATPSASSR